MTRRYFAIPRALDRRPIEQRTCDTCGQSFEVRVPSVATEDDWTTCPACETARMMREIDAQCSHSEHCPGPVVSFGEAGNYCDTHALMRAMEDPR